MKAVRSVETLGMSVFRKYMAVPVAVQTCQQTNRYTTLNDNMLRGSEMLGLYVFRGGFFNTKSRCFVRFEASSHGTTRLPLDGFS